MVGQYASAKISPNVPKYSQVTVEKPLRHCPLRSARNWFFSAACVTNALQSPKLLWTVVVRSQPHTFPLTSKDRDREVVRVCTHAWYDKNDEFFLLERLILMRSVSFTV